MSLNLYIHFKFLLPFLNAQILRAEGIKYIAIGYKIPNKKLNKESFRNVIWVFSYTPQNEDTVYQ